MIKIKKVNIPIAFVLKINSFCPGLNKKFVTYIKNSNLKKFTLQKNKQQSLHSNKVSKKVLETKKQKFNYLPAIECFLPA